jgi:ribose-phosphate pyrophosphokinase
VRPTVVALPDNGALAALVAEHLDGDLARACVRPFPDGETYVRIDHDVTGRCVILVCSLDRPNERTLPLLLLAATARDLGARRVGLVAPYLAYMRQDRRFHPGEGVTSAYFARLLSSTVDWLVTVDPHLHRRRSLAELYAIPTQVVHAAPLVAAWLGANVRKPVLVGPDVESAQWVGAIADRIGAPSIVLHKVRRGDHDVEVSLPADAPLTDRTPVLIDDVVSTGGTMLATIAHLRRVGARAPVCVAIHGVFAGDAYERLLASGAERVVTCNTIPHPSNDVDVAEPLAAAVQTLLDA